MRTQSSLSAQANNPEKGTAAGGGSISSSSSISSSASTCAASPEASAVVSKYGDGDSGGSETSETGVKGCMWGGDHPKKPLDTIIFNENPNPNPNYPFLL
ncbi:hypothetical protein V6Z12_D04G073900 [Gossypium hirsutum]